MLNHRRWFNHYFWWALNKHEVYNSHTFKTCYVAQRGKQTSFICRTCRVESWSVLSFQSPILFFFLPISLPLMPTARIVQCAAKGIRTFSRGRAGGSRSNLFNVLYRLHSTFTPWVQGTTCPFSQRQIQITYSIFKEIQNETEIWLWSHQLKSTDSSWGILLFSFCLSLSHLCHLS